jgi:polyphosphate:AMP phosphotransferase
MFESAELNHEISKKVYEKDLPALRDDLLKLQSELVLSSKFSVIIVIGGVDGAGKGEVVNLLNEWMDPRHIQTHAYGPPSEEERERPAMWRFWRDLPPKGKIGIFFGSWYTAPIVNHVIGQTKGGQFRSELEEVRRFEKMLTDEGTLILKFWLHLSKENQKHRLKSLEKNPKTRWRITDEDWKRFKIYDKFKKISEEALRLTSVVNSPWLVVEGTDEYYRAMTVGKAIQEAIRERLKDQPPKKNGNGISFNNSIDKKDLLDDLDLTQALSKKDYSKQLEHYQGKLNLLSRDPRFKQISVIAVFEGNDAAGKGGSIRRITGALDARFYGITPVAAPTEEEKQQPYLWRFWRHLPRFGRFTIFDRSWYGRVLVERVEGYCSSFDWQRAYSEISDFEKQLTDHKTVVIKFWLAISEKEQLKRFKERQKISYKNFKITKEDWRNRHKWPKYKEAVCAMVDRTSAENSQWHLIESEDKYFGRIKILKILCASVEQELSKIDSKKKD